MSNKASGFHIGTSSFEPDNRVLSSYLADGTLTKRYFSSVRTRTTVRVNSKGDTIVRTIREPVIDHTLYRGDWEISGYLGSGMAMDKSVTKRMMDSLGIRTAPWHDIHYTESDIPRLAEELPVPCAVKIVNGGSSIGVELPDTREELAQTLERMLAYGDHVIVEQKIRGREIQVAVLGDGYLPAVEIIPKGAYFDYFCKYQKDGAQELCPAPITDEQWHTVGELALRLHRALGLGVYSRADFILDEEGRFWCLEINTLPGMTPTSLVPQEAAAAGIGYGELCERIVTSSLRARKEGRA